MKTQKKYLIIVLITVTVFGLVFFALRFLLKYGPEPQINQKAFDQIKLGMTQDEVEIILGCLPGDYGPDSTGSRRGVVRIPESPSREKLWIDGHIGIYIFFDGNGRVEWCDLELNRMTSEDSWFNRMRRWFKHR